MKSIRIAFARFLPKWRIAALWLGLASLSTAQALSVLPLYLEELIDTSAVAFEGTCTGNRTERDAATNLVVTYTTFAVHDVLKGSVDTTHVIKQVGGSIPGDDLQYLVPGIPKFAVGENYVVFLAGVSSAGFSSPIGLGQGRFSIKSEGAARKVSNGRDFRDLTARILPGLPATAKARLQQDSAPVRDMDLDEFKQIVRTHVGAGR